ncbi:hypothetical protein V2J09_021778 [Rumex salicifolius]
MASSAACPLCHQDEMTLHTLRDCPASFGLFYQAIGCTLISFLIGSFLTLLVRMGGDLPLQTWSGILRRRILLNTDAISKGIFEIAACGGIFRDHMGQHVLSFAFRCGACPLVTAELLANKIGLSLVGELNITQLVVQTDSAIAHSLLSSSITPLNPNFYVVQDCKALLTRQSWRVRLDHIRRAANMVADKLANFSLTFGSAVSIFIIPHACISSLISTDLVTSFEVSFISI